MYHKVLWKSIDIYRMPKESFIISCNDMPLRSDFIIYTVMNINILIRYMIKIEIHEAQAPKLVIYPYWHVLFMSNPEYFSVVFLRCIQHDVWSPIRACWWPFCHALVIQSSYGPFLVSHWSWTYSERSGPVPSHVSLKHPPGFHAGCPPRWYCVTLSSWHNIPDLYIPSSYLLTASQHLVSSVVRQ